MKKNTWKDYFTFSTGERNAVVILLIIIGAFIVLPFLFQPKEKNILPDEKLREQIAQLQKTDSSESLENTGENESSAAAYSQPAKNYQPVRAADSLFYFDPNTVDENGLQSLGLTEKNIHTVINYRNKGGRFFKPADLGKIYGISKLKVDELIPFIKIKNQQSYFQNKTFYKKDSTFTTSAKPFIAKKYSVIHINSATAEDFKTLPGIGDVIGNRIIKFRDKIGGFKSVDDVKKTYGLSDSVFKNIQPYLKLN